MICRRCKMVMGTGTSYEQRKERYKTSHRRYFECRKCHDKVYINVPDFCGAVKREPDKRRKISI